MASTGKSGKFSSLDDLFMNQVEIKDWSEAPTKTEIISKSALSFKAKAITPVANKSPENVIPMKKHSSVPNFKNVPGYSRNRSPLQSATSGYGSGKNFPSSSSVKSFSRQLLPALRDPPFYVYATNINFRARREEIFYFFGGERCVKQIHMYLTDENRFVGDCFIQAVDNREIFDAMLKKDHEWFLNRPVILYAVDPKNGRKYSASLFNSQPYQTPVVERNPSSSNDARKSFQSWGSESKGIRDKKEGNSGGSKCDVFATTTSKERPPQLRENKNIMKKREFIESIKSEKPRKVKPKFEFPQMDRALPKQNTLVSQKGAALGVKERKSASAHEDGREASVAKDVEEAMLVKEEKPALVTKDVEEAMVVKEERPASVAKEEKSASELEDDKEASVAKDVEEAMVVKEENPASVFKDGKEAIVVEEEKPASVFKDGKEAIVVEEEKPSSVLKDGREATVVNDEKEDMVVSTDIAPSVVSDENE